MCCAKVQVRLALGLGPASYDRAISSVRRLTVTSPEQDQTKNKEHLGQPSSPMDRARIHPVSLGVPVDTLCHLVHDENQGYTGSD